MTEANQRLLTQERLLLDVAEAVNAVMEDRGITRAVLARRLGKTRAFVTQVLGGDRNMRLRTLADICYALEVHPSIVICPARAIPRTKGERMNNPNVRESFLQPLDETLNPPTMPSADGTATLTKFYFIGAVYAHDKDDASERLEGANIYIDAAQVFGNETQDAVSLVDIALDLWREARDRDRKVAL